MNFTNPPLSGSDIKRRFNGNTKVLLYDKLAQYDDIDSLLSPYGHCFILLQSKPEFGHWICLMKWSEHIVWCPSLTATVTSLMTRSSLSTTSSLCSLVRHSTTSAGYSPQGIIQVHSGVHTVPSTEEEGQTCGYMWTVVLSVCGEYKGPGVDGFYWYIRDFGNP